MERLDHSLFSLLVLFGLQLNALERCLASGPPEEPTRRQIESMSAEAKNALLRKKKRFDALPRHQQLRMRSLHQQIANDPRSEALRTTLVRYTEWLKSLTPEQRSLLQGLSSEERIRKIQELRHSEARTKPRSPGMPRLPIEDLRTVYSWFDHFLSQRQDQIMVEMPKRLATQLARMNDVKRKRRILWRAYLTGLNNDSVPLPARADFEQLLTRLSPRGRNALRETTSQDNSQSRKKIVSWIAQTGLMRDLMNDDQLQRFFQNELSDVQRQRLDQLPIADRMDELRRMYFGQGARSRPAGSRGTSQIMKSQIRSSGDQPNQRRRPMRPTDRQTEQP